MYNIIMFDINISNSIYKSFHIIRLILIIK